jgi:hypothetical protein
MSNLRPAVSAIALCLLLASHEPFFGQEPSPAALKDGVQATPGKTPAEKQAYLVRTAWVNTYSDLRLFGELLIIKSFQDNYELMKSARAKPFAQFAPGLDPRVVRPEPRFPQISISESYDYYQKHPRALQMVLEAQLREYRQKVQSIAAGEYYISDPDGRYKFLALACDVIGPACAKTKGLAKLILDEELGPEQQHRFDAERRWQMASLPQIVANLQKLALEDGVFRDIVDSFVGVTSGVNTKDPIETILKNRGDILAKQRDELTALRAKATDERSKKILDLSARLYAQQKEILARLETIEKGEKITAGELAELKRKFVALQAEIARLSMPGAGSKADASLDPAEREALNRALQSSVGLMTTIIGTHDAKAAKTFNAVASSGVQFVNVLEGYRADKVKLGPEVASRALTLNIVSIVTNFAGAMIQALSGQPSMDQLIYDQIIELRKQVKELGDQMHNRFDAVDSALNRIYGEMVKEFYEIKQAEREMRKSLANIAASLGALHDRLSEHESRLRDYLDALADRQRADEITASLRHADHYTSDLTDAAFERCLTLFHACALHDAGDALASGTLPKGRDLDAELLTRGLRGRHESELRFLSVLAERYGIQGLADGDAPDTPRPLNPQLWSESAQKYIRMGMLYPDKFQRLVKRDPKSGRYTQLAEIIAAGNQAQNSLYRITTAPTFDEKVSSRPNVEPMRQLLREYVDTLRELSAATEARRDELRRDLSIGDTSYKIADREPLLGPGQPEPEPEKSRRPKFKVGPIALSDALKEAVPNDPHGRQWYGNFTRLALDPPEGIEALIPVEFRHAQEMGLGTIKVCFAEAGIGANVALGAVPTPGLTMTREEWLYLRKMRFTIQAEFFQGNQLKGVIFRRTLAVHADYISTLYKFKLEGFDFPDMAQHYWTYGCRAGFMKDSISSSELFRMNQSMEKKLREANEWFLAKVEKEKQDHPVSMSLWRWTKQKLAQLDLPYYDVDTLRPQLRAALAVAHAELGKKLSADLETGCLKKSADKLTAARTKLEAIMTLGWNESMRHDPVLLTLFRGANGLPTKDEIVEAYRQLPVALANDMRLPEAKGPIAITLPRGDLLESSLNSSPRSINADALEKRVQALSDAATFEAIFKLIPEAQRLEKVWNPNSPEHREKLQALVRLELVRTLQNRDIAAHLRFLGTLVKNILDDAKVMADTGMTKEQLASLKKELSAGRLSPVNELRLKVLALYGKLFRELLARGDGHEDYPALARTLFLLDAFEKKARLDSAAP